MNSHDFFDCLCSEVKYKSIHSSIRTELDAHLEETAQAYIKDDLSPDEARRRALTQMGDAQEIGRMFNKEYRLPFNCRFGLSIWAAIVTMLIYGIYPFLYQLWKSRVIKSPYSDFLIIGIIFMFMAINVLYLRRGRKIVTIRDMGQITVGFMIGYAVSAVILIGMSYLAEPGYYAYMPNVRLLFMPPYIPLLPIPMNVNVFSIQGFCWWLCLIVYVAAVKSRKEVNPSLLWNCFSVFRIHDGTWVYDFDNFARGRTADGKHLTSAGNAFFGLRVDKYGERIKDMRDNDDVLY